ncbi:MULTISPECIES: hypothetical protein [Niastella]|uniref:DUF4397 domain-containing protein n=1 Tax=Niastella soli TaxID=2821487 RepID=A0ABS3Z4W4_9BACT|nr:hypothetical protein [Niastella soli]MBO9205186.1 hypothetical protein [Niastella soli]
MNGRIIRMISAVILILFVTACNKREEAITESKYANATITTFTVDSLLFSVRINNTLLIDTLTSPAASVFRQFSFYDTVVHLQVFEKNIFNRMVIDTNLNIHLGNNNINIVQMKSDEKPSLPTPPVGSSPDSGYCNVKFVYTAPSSVSFLDSVKCEIIVDASTAGNGSVPKSVDTVVLSRYEFTDEYYLVKKSTNSFRIKVYDPVTNSLIRQTEFANVTSYANYNAVNLSASTFYGQTVYNLIRAF